MDERFAILAELEQSRERATRLIQAKLAAIVEQLREAAARAESDLGMVLPPDPEVFFSLKQAEALLEAIPPEPTPPTVGRELVEALDRGRAQSEVLQEMLRRIEPWCSRRAVLVFREGRVSGWAGAGFEGPDPSRAWQGAVASSRALARAAAGVPVVAPIAGDGLIDAWLDADDGPVAVIPMALRGNVVGALLAVGNDEEFDVEPVQVLVFVTGLLLETLAVRTSVPTPALLPVEIFERDEGVRAVGPSEAAFAPPHVTVETRGGETTLPTQAPAGEAGPTPAVVAQAMEEPEGRTSVEIVSEVAPTPEVETTLDEVARPAVEAAATEAPTAPAGYDDASATLHLAVPITPEVKPRTPEQERKHEEARRFARLLVSEVRLYNEQAVVEGKADRDIYHRLKEDIDRSREMYEQRVSSEIRAESNYFFDELVRILADGDPDALGL
jgi:hypothetical protein